MATVSSVELSPAVRGPLRAIEIETLAAFDELAARNVQMRGWQLQGVDLTGRDEVLARLDPRGALLLGCRLSPPAATDLRRRGALVFPSVPDVPFDAYRAHLYTASELYAGLESRYEDTTDALIYAWATAANHTRTGGTSVHDNLAMALHDAAIDDALAEFVDDRRIVGVMGGHAVDRGLPAYADAVGLGKSLAEAGCTVATGGGPGAMEAANLGATLAGAAATEVSDVLARIAEVPTFRPSITDWARAGFKATDRSNDLSLGVPTWFYGHEPPNPFCTRIAKYFRNAIREDVLLHICNAGIVFLPGAAGTVQEVFAAACENYYAPPSKQVDFVLVGRQHWTEELPVWPLLVRLAASSPGFGSRLQLIDDAKDVAAALGKEL